MPDEIITDGSPPDAAQRRAGEYVVIARRYRPQTFNELIGQEHVAKGLAAAIETSRVGHAYLFTGARGTGKTSTARILAKSLNCERGPTATPCNECDICLSITRGDDMDVLEIDGASNRGIDEIRQLRQNVNVRPSRARFKIYIIDEVHMLTKEAFNALLKTLEEPPEHVKFIFCTTEPEKIPITILSRCQRFDFAGIQTKQIVARLEQIIASEHVDADHEALEILARRAAGSMRDSQSLLEQLLAFGAKRITVAEVHALLGTAGTERIEGLVGHLVKRDGAAALAELDRAVGEGVDVGQLLDQLLGYFRDVMATAVGCPAEALLYVSPAEQGTVRNAAGQLGLETVLAVLGILDQTISRLKYAAYPRIAAELAIVRICKLEDLESLPQVIAQLRASLPAQSAPVAAASTSAAAMSKKKFDEPEVTTVSDSARPPASHAANGNGHSTIAPAIQQPAPPESVAAHSSNGNGSTPSIPLPLSDQALSIWKQAATQLGGLAAEKAMQASDAAIIAPNKLVVTFPRKYNFCKQFCERAEISSQIAEIVARLAGQPLGLQFSLADEASQEQEAARPTTLRQRMNEVCQRPLVRQAIELFNATPVRLEEPERSSP